MPVLPIQSSGFSSGASVSYRAGSGARPGMDLTTSANCQACSSMAEPLRMYCGLLVLDRPFIRRNADQARSGKQVEKGGTNAPGIGPQPGTLV